MKSDTPLSAQSALYSTPFLLLCASNFVFAASFQMLIPELPDHLTALGGANYKGWILALFTLTAGVSRPFSGKLTDSIGRVPVMIFGSLVCVICSLFYPIITTVYGFLLLRFFHGFSTGFKPTATAAYTADLVDVHRRGEAMSALGMSSSIGMSIAPLIGSAVTVHFGFNTMCLLSAAFALVSVVILVGTIEETLPNKQKFSPVLLKVKRHEIYDPRAIPTFIVQFLVAFASGVVLNIIPDMTKLLGIENKGLFFGIYTFSSLLIRIFLGKSSDKYGRITVLKFSSLTMFFSLLFVAWAHTPFMFIISAIIYGFSWGMNTPTLQAWVVDLVAPENRGRGFATMFMGLESGIGVGALTSQFIYKNDPARIDLPFYLSAVLALAAFIYLNFKKEASY